MVEYTVRFKAKAPLDRGWERYHENRDFVVAASDEKDALDKASMRLLQECFRDPAHYTAYVVNT